MQLKAALKLFSNALYGEVAPKTLRWYVWFDEEDKVHGLLASLLDTFGEEASTSQITAHQLRDWRAALFSRTQKYGNQKPVEAGELSVSTKRGHIQAVRRFFSWMLAEKMISVDPSIRLKMPQLPDQEPKAIEPADFQALITAAKERSERELAIVLFLADTGCRVGGLCGLQTTNLYLDEMKAMVWEKGKGGKGKSRWVYFSRETYTALCAWLSVRPVEGSDYVFLGKRGPLKTAGVYQMLKRLAERAGITGRFNPHSFRHAAARNWLQNGGNLSTVSQLLGHSDIHVTNKFYARWTPQELQNWHGRLSPFSSVEKLETAQAS